MFGILITGLDVELKLNQYEKKIIPWKFSLNKLEAVGHGD